MVVLTALFIASPLFSQQNLQKTYPLRSPEYEAIRSLYIEQGLALPFGSGPFPEAELRHALGRIDPNRLSDAGLRNLDWLRKTFSRPRDYQEENGSFQFEAGAEFSLEAYLHTDGDNRYMEYAWKDRRPLARLPIEGWVGTGAYAIFDLEFKKNIPDFSIYPTYESSGRYDFDANGDFGFTTEEMDPFTNVFYNINTMDVMFPHRAFLSVGGERWNAQLGRDVVDWGNGRTGNLYISDNGNWHDALQLSTFWDRFKFSWIWVSLDGKITDQEREFRADMVGWDTDGDGEVDAFVDPAEDPSVDADTTKDNERITAYTADVEKKNLIAQRWEVRFWDRLGLAYTEGIIFGRDTVELRHLNPLYHYHNLYTNTQNVGNAHRSFEFDLAVTPGLSFYAVLCPDQWSSPLEPTTNITEEPNAVAYLAGLDYRKPIGEGYLRGTFEAVYATPWMHIHNHPLTSITQRRYVMAQHGDQRTQVWIDSPLGHYGGNDFALIWLDVSYGQAGHYRYGVNAYYEGDGSVPINALLQSKVTDGLRGEITEDEAKLSAPSEGYDGAKTMWRSALSVYGELYPRFSSDFNSPESRRTLRLGGEIAGQFTKNRYNLPSDWAFDPQLVLSATYGF